MLIDQLPTLASPTGTDEIPIERGTTTYKATLEKLVSALHLSISSFSSFPKTVNNSLIQSDMRVVECVWGTPTAITSDVTWTTANGSLTLSGSISGSTTAEITLIRTY